MAPATDYSMLLLAAALVAVVVCPAVAAAAAQEAPHVAPPRTPAPPPADRTPHELLIDRDYELYRKLESKAIDDHVPPGKERWGGVRAQLDGDKDVEIVCCFNRAVPDTKTEKADPRKEVLRDRERFSDGLLVVLDFDGQEEFTKVYEDRLDGELTSFNANDDFNGDGVSDLLYSIGGPRVERLKIVTFVPKPEVFGDFTSDALRIAWRTKENNRWNKDIVAVYRKRGFLRQPLVRVHAYDPQKKRWEVIREGPQKKYEADETEFMLKRQREGAW